MWSHAVLIVVKDEHEIWAVPVGHVGQFTTWRSSVKVLIYISSPLPGNACEPKSAHMATVQTTSGISDLL